MKRINLTKYGFIRWPEEDFDDDGNKFQGYRAGKAVKVSKLVSDGQVYLSIAASECGNGSLPYEVYSKLPYYNEANWKYNGVSIDSLTEDDIQAFYEACISYEQAYLETEATIVYPTIEEITEQCEKIRMKIGAEIAEVEGILKNNIIEIVLKFTEFNWKELRTYLRNLIQRFNGFDPSVYPKTLYKTSASFRFVQPTNSDLAIPNFWYKEIMKMLTSYNII